LPLISPKPIESKPIDPDQGLIERFRAGERPAFDALVRRYQQPIYYLALRYLKNEADASDATQQTFVKVFKSLQRFRGASTFRTWIYRIAINLCLNHLRDKRREQPSEIAEDALTTTPTGPQRLIDDEQTKRLREAISELPPKQRMVLELRIYDELKFREVAELINCSENAAKVNFHHAVTRLRVLLEKPEG
jgi:RNA polymerase sigma-70 factor (ECF subfamily)